MPIQPPRNIYWTSAAGPATTIPPSVLFCTFRRLLTSYMFIGAPDDLPRDDPELLTLLAGLGLPDLPDSLQTLLSYLFAGMLQMATRRSEQHRPILGGLKQPNSFRKADLEQFFYEEEQVLKATSMQAYQPLAGDFRQIYRLLRWAQCDYQGQRREVWRAKHIALSMALLRVYEVGVRLCEIGGRWFAEVCLRRLFRELWQEQFGSKVSYPEAVKPFIERVKVTLVLRNSVIKLLRGEREAGLEVAPPFGEVVGAWEGGEWPRSLNSQVSQEEWESMVPVRWV
ncbi:MAG TPA: hypothetical protein VH540_22395 [Ktedonobacterales bacterium]|jgi:hypothetical protein